MRPMLRLMLILALLFASTFLVLNLTGFITLERIQNWLTLGHKISPVIIGLSVTVLLFADLFVAMPTLTIMLLSGFYLGPIVGAAFSIAGLLLAGFTGYVLSHRFGDCIINMIIRNEEDRNQATQSFRRHGVTTILFSRAVPILPEVSACMAGLTRMPLFVFIPTWTVSTVPYASIAAYAGSISSASNPHPAIYTAIGLTSFFWVAWFLNKKRILA